MTNPRTHEPMLAEPLLDSLAHRLLEAKMLERLVGGDQQTVRVDRFAIEQELGSGGMGTIYAAWDEQLRRRVALKFLHRSGSDDEGEQRLFREAQALAQLSHPNVVPVYDVGRHEGRVWLAMEHIEGQTLRAWAKETPRRRPEILRVWMAAGQGLAAIHAAGLVHRDIKPDNIMIGADGRVRIVDFGLVRLADAVQASASGSALSTEQDWVEGLTTPDGFVGTPAYASPEQVGAEGIDARSDQFAFCVSLWEALCGKRPSRVRGPDGRPEPAEGPGLPPGILRALSRGLALDPQRRFEDMPALLAALAPRRRRWLVPGLVGVGAAAIGLVAGMMLLADSNSAVAEDPCAHAGDELAEIWSADRLSPLESALPEPAVTRAREALGAWESAWEDAAREACQDVHVRQQRSPQSLDRRGVCLDRRLSGLTALGDAIDAGRIGKERELVAWLGRLGEPRDCLAEGVLASEIEAPPSEHADAVVEIRRQLRGLGMSTREMSLGARIAEGERLHAQAEALGWRPLIGEVALELGHLHTLASDAAAARRWLGQALDAAELTGDVEIQSLVWSALNRVERTLSLDPERAEWTLQRQAAVFTDIEPTVRQRARMATDRGLGFELGARRPEAERELREALRLYEGLGATAAWEQAALLRTLGYLVVDIERSEEALVLMRRARELVGERPAEGNPSQTSQLDALLMLNEAIALLGAGRPDDAADEATRALERAHEQVGPRSEAAARVHVVLAAIYAALGDGDRERRHVVLADEISLAAVGPEHALRVDVLNAVGMAAYGDGRLEDASRAFERALTVVRRIKPADSLEVAQAEFNLADVQAELGKLEAAKRLIVHALPVLERELPEDHPMLAMARALAAR